MAGTMPQEGDAAPDFTLEVDAGGSVNLKKLRGKPVVVYFYPKDDTPGCTKEALAFTGALEDFEAAGATVIGISKDSCAAHAKFRDKYMLEHTLAADEDGKVCEAYGVWAEKVNYGKKYMGIVRATFLIDGKGVIRRVWPKVRVDGHAEEVLEAVRALGGAGA